MGRGVKEYESTCEWEKGRGDEGMGGDTVMVPWNMRFALAQEANLISREGRGHRVTLNPRNAHNF